MLGSVSLAQMARSAKDRGDRLFEGPPCRRCGTTTRRSYDSGQCDRCRRMKEKSRSKINRSWPPKACVQNEAARRGCHAFVSECKEHGYALHSTKHGRCVLCVSGDDWVPHELSDTAKGKRARSKGHTMFRGSECSCGCKIRFASTRECVVCVSEKKRNDPSMPDRRKRRYARALAKKHRDDIAPAVLALHAVRSEIRKMHRSGVDWDNVPLLGLVPDADIARCFNVTRATVRQVRKRRGL